MQEFLLHSQTEHRNDTMFLDDTYRPPHCKEIIDTVVNGADPTTTITAATMPHDVLSMIFYETIHYHDAGVENFNSSIPTISYLSSASPIPLAQVCSHWRAVAITSGLLWSEICIDHPRDSHLWLAKLWLQRAGDHPLKLTIKTSPYLPVETSCFSEILRLLVSKICQWKEIDFDLPSECIRGFAPILLEKNCLLKQLESAAVSVHTRTNRLYKLRDNDQTRSSTLPVDNIWESIHSSPSLKYVNWRNLYEGLSLPKHAPWSQLTRLDLDYFMRIADIFHILSLSPNMKMLRAEGAPKIPYEQGGVSFPIGFVHKLHTLCLTATAEMGDFFANIELPELRKLYISYQGLPRSLDSSDRKHEGISWNLAKKFRYFLSQSRCNLEDVWLNSLPYSDDDLCSHLSSPAFQSVSRLRLSGMNLVTDNVIQAMTLQQGGVGILTRLTRLWLDFGETEITDGLISTMVASRWLLRVTHIRLEDVRLTRDFLQPFSFEDVKKLSSMLAEGLQISVSPGSLNNV